MIYEILPLPLTSQILGQFKRSTISNHIWCFFHQFIIFPVNARRKSVKKPGSDDDIVINFYEICNKCEISEKIHFYIQVFWENWQSWIFSLTNHQYYQAKTNISLTILDTNNEYYIIMFSITINFFLINYNP